jgi:FKBP-type peptidyl-prolyl cis-trans isomerase 2
MTCKLNIVKISLVFFLLLISIGNVSAEEIKAEDGDLAIVEYTASLENGEMFYTTNEAVFKSPNKPKADWFVRTPEFKPESIVVGKSSLFPQMANVIRDMKVGDVKKVTLPPEEAFGVKDPKMLVSRPKQSVIPRVIRMGAVEFANRYKIFPTVGENMDFNEYLKVKVTDLAKRFVTLEVITADGTKIQDDFGVTTISIDDNKVTMSLDVEEGTYVKGFAGQFENQRGRIVEVKEDEFIVDFNPPTRGSTIVLDIKMVDLKKSDVFNDIELTWHEMFQEGIKSAREGKKPAVIVMHSETCGWCTRYFGDSMKDPRIKTIKDDFVWVKVDINQEPEISKKFNVEGTPVTVLMSPEGELLKTLEGYKDGGELYQELQGLLLVLSNRS